MIERETNALMAIYKEDVTAQHFSDLSFALVIMLIKQFDNTVHQIRDISEVR
jgi:hypothetical protein